MYIPYNHFFLLVKTHSIVRGKCSLKNSHDKNRPSLRMWPILTLRPLGELKWQQNLGICVFKLHVYLGIKVNKQLLCCYLFYNGFWKHVKITFQTKFHYHRPQSVRHTFENGIPEINCFSVIKQVNYKHGSNTEHRKTVYSKERTEL